ncbi:MAG: hypothetical protein CMJ27_10525 [Phycisphaerae bacterium]|nr:hypothetical protein [Phycisphaerae bacterium]
MRRGRGIVARRGGLLLETLVAVAIFVGVATFSLAAVRDGIAAAERARLRLVAVGLATSRIAEIEAGLVSPWAVGEVDAGDDASAFDAEPSPLRLEMEAGPSDFDGLVRVMVSVYEEEVDPSPLIEPRRLARLVALVPDVPGVDGDGEGDVETDSPPSTSEVEVRP